MAASNTLRVAMPRPRPRIALRFGTWPTRDLDEGQPAHTADLWAGHAAFSPVDHAAALEAMIADGRKPTSMSPSDFDYEYVERPAFAAGRRFEWLRFGCPYDSLTVGRRGAHWRRHEAQLNPYRRRFVVMFERLRRATAWTSRAT